MTIQVGDIVKVAALRLLCTGCEGRVTSTASGDPKLPFLVSFGMEYEDTFRHNGAGDGPFVVHFRWIELKKLSDWSVEVRAQQLFGQDRFHSLAILKTRFSPDSSCMFDCAEKMTRRVLLNLCGTIYPAYACEAHAAEWDGKYVEILPFGRKPIPEAATA